MLAITLQDFECGMKLTIQHALEKLGRWPENKARKILEVLQINAYSGKCIFWEINVYSGKKPCGSAVLRMEGLPRQ